MQIETLSAISEEIGSVLGSLREEQEQDLILRSFLRALHAVRLITLQELQEVVNFFIRFRVDVFPTINPNEETSRRIKLDLLCTLGAGYV